MDFYEEFLNGLADTPQQPAIEPLWTVELDGRIVSCELRYHGRGYGVEVQICDDGQLRIGQRFETKELAVDWAQSEWIAATRR